MSLRNTIVLALISGAALSASTLAGPLNPPAGPVTSSYKTLSEVEPRTAVNATNTPGDVEAIYVISASGSYYLSGNITGTSGKKGIKITASNVTLDLNGFSMIGGGVADDAINTPVFPATQNIIIRNGNILNWVKEGVDAYYTSNCRIENVQVASSLNGYGIITGPGSSIAGCNVRGSGAGIVTTDGCTVTQCTAYGNTGAGFLIGNGNTVIGCVAQGTTTGPGFQAGAGCTIKDCAAYVNLGTTAHGFTVASGCTVTSCTARGNDQDGFHILADSFNTSLIGCTSTLNKQNGFKAENGVGYRISDSVASRNNRNGIEVTGSCAVINNTCEDNGALVGATTSAIYVTFNGNRIDGNHVVGSAYGINVASGTFNNLAVRNTAAFCTTPYSFPATCTYGAINFLPSGSFADTNSWANLKF